MIFPFFFSFRCQFLSIELLVAAQMILERPKSVISDDYNLHIRVVLVPLKTKFHIHLLSPNVYDLLYIVNNYDIQGVQKCNVCAFI